MNNYLKSEICFDDFYTLYRSQGVVALAWWLGALHADRIREEHNSFPFLHVVGEAGSGKSLLLGYLWKLLGEEEFSACAPEFATPTGRRRVLLNGGKPVVILESWPNPESSFDWDEIKDLYSGGIVGHSRPNGMEQPHFRGALSIISNAPIEASDALKSRMALVEIGGARSQESMNSAQVLRDLHIVRAGAFGRAAEQNREQQYSTFSKLAPAYTAALLGERPNLSTRAAKNGGQMMAWVDVLSLMLGLSNELRLAALDTTKMIVDEEFTPF